VTLGKYFYPVDPKRTNLKTVDAFMVVNFFSKVYLIMFQDTVSKDHGVQLQGLENVQKAVVAKLAKDVKISDYALLFRTPPAAFEFWKTPRAIKKSDGKVVSEKNQGKYEQYVCCLKTRDLNAVW
jgi:hypothetical protein